MPCPLVTPLRMMSVPCPSTRGPKTLRNALVTATTNTTTSTTHIGPSIPPRRRSAFLKSFDRSAGTPAEFQRPAARVSGAARSSSSSSCGAFGSSRTVMTASCRFALLADLRLHDLGVGRARRDELVVGALAYDRAVLQHEDVV